MKVMMSYYSVVGSKNTRACRCCRGRKMKRIGCIRYSIFVLTLLFVTYYNLTSYKQVVQANNNNNNNNNNNIALYVRMERNIGVGGGGGRFQSTFQTWMHAKIMNARNLLQATTLYVHGLDEDNNQTTSLTFNNTQITVTGSSSSSTHNIDNNNSRQSINNSATSHYDISKGNQITWSGVLTDRGSSSSNSITSSNIGFATIIRFPNGNIAGSFMTEEATYSIVKIPSTRKYQIRKTFWQDFPIDTINDDDLMDDNNNNNIITGNTIKSSRKSGQTTTSFYKIHELGRSFDYIRRRSYNNEMVLFEKINESNNNNNNNNPLSHTNQNTRRKNKNKNRGRNLRLLWNRTVDNERRKIQLLQYSNNNSIIDVGVLVTNRALCEFANKLVGCNIWDNYEAMFERLALLETETNLSFFSMKMPIRIRLVSIVFIPWFVDYDPSDEQTILEVMETNEDIQNWKRRVGADVITFIAGGYNFTTCGLSRLYNSSSYVNYKCFDQYSFTHEIGHTIGARHDQANCGSQHPYGHGYQDPNGLFRTIMAYPCPNKPSCPRIPYWSSDTFLYQGKPLGDGSHNNARLIKENGPSVADWVPKERLFPIAPP